MTRYCDRVIDSFPCKQRGSRFQRNEGREKDEALHIYKQLRDRMYARFLRYQDAAPEERSKLLPMDYGRYDTWSENASAALREYKAGTITAEEFLRKIDTTHELESYETGKVKLTETKETPWQSMVARSWKFDPARFFPEEMMVLNLGKPNPQWQMLTADELRRRTQKGHQSLREKYGKA